jgi:hypothetical protein
MKPVLGIDPGQSGAICLIHSEGIKIWKMPDTIQGIYELLFGLNLPGCHVLCESQHGRPAYNKRVSEDGHEVIEPIRGATAIWTFAEHYGTLKGLLYALGGNQVWCHCDVWERECFMAPRSWMNLLGILKREKSEKQAQWKGRLWEKAKSLYPQEKILKQCADAVLIAETCRRIHALEAKKPKLDFGDL